MSENAAARRTRNLGKNAIAVKVSIVEYEHRCFEEATRTNFVYSFCIEYEPDEDEPDAENKLDEDDPDTENDPDEDEPDAVNDPNELRRKAKKFVVSTRDQRTKYKRKLDKDPEDKETQAYVEQYEKKYDIVDNLFKLGEYEAVLNLRKRVKGQITKTSNAKDRNGPSVRASYVIILKQRQFHAHRDRKVQNATPDSVQQIEKELEQLYQWRKDQNFEAIIATGNPNNGRNAYLKKRSSEWTEEERQRRNDSNWLNRIKNKSWGEMTLNHQLRYNRIMKYRRDERRERLRKESVRHDASQLLQREPNTENPVEVALCTKLRAFLIATLS